MLQNLMCIRSLDHDDFFPARAVLFGSGARRNRGVFLFFSPRARLSVTGLFCSTSKFLSVALSRLEHQRGFQRRILC